MKYKAKKRRIITEIIDVSKSKLKNECDIELKALVNDIKNTSIDDC